MLRIKKLIILSVFIFTQITLFAQNNTNSPYTRYGYGEIANRSLGAGRAMGGLGVGLRMPNQINPMNPASYSAMDSLTFLFDFGVMAQFSWFKDGLGKKQNDMNGNIEYLAMQFPLAKGLGMSVGLIPFSHVGYDFMAKATDNPSANDQLYYIERYKGNGSLSEIYAGLAYDLWKKRLSIGVNVGYMFGTLTHSGETDSIASTGSDKNYWNKRIKINDVKFDLGVHYTHPLSKTDNLVLGAVFSPGKKMNSESTNIRWVNVESQGDTIKNQGFEIPNSFGFGVSYNRTNKFTVGADVQLQQWKDAKFFDKSNQFKNRMRVALGGEYIPNMYERNYFKRVKYRAGLHYSNSYLKVDARDAMNNVQKGSYKEYGASLGLGFPLVDYRSVINFSLEYVKVKPELKAMIDEQYFRITLNLTFNEMWFRKRKLD